MTLKPETGASITPPRLPFSFLTASPSPAGAAVPGAPRRAARHQGGERPAEADQRRAGERAGADQPGAAAGPGAAERAAGAVVAAARGQGDVSVRLAAQRLDRSDESSAA